jgi:hypothetical protein
MTVSSALSGAGSGGACRTRGGDRILEPLTDPHRERPAVTLGKFGERLIQLVADPQRDPMARSAGFSGTHAGSIGHPGQSVKNSLGYRGLPSAPMALDGVNGTPIS